MKPKPGGWYLVAQGESVESIAVSSGHLFDAIWEAAENQELRAEKELYQIAERKEGGFVVVLNLDGADQVRRLDRNLSDRWRRGIGLGWGVLSPPWTDGVLFVDQQMHIALIDESPGLRRANIDCPDDMPRPAASRTTIGQIPGGEWIVAWHDGFEWPERRQRW